MKKIYYRFIGLVAVLVVTHFFPCFGLNFSFSQEIIPDNEPNDNSLIYQISKNLDRGSYKTAFKTMKGANFEKLSKDEKQRIVKKIVHLSIYYQEINNPDSTLLFSRFADSINTKYNLANTNVNCEIKYLKGWSLYKKSRVDKALIEFNNALSGCKSENDSLEVLILKYLGNIYFINRNFKKAYNYYHKSLNLELSRKNPSDAIIAGLYQNKGIIHASYKNYDSARIFFRESIQLKVKVMDQNDPKLANGYLNFSLFLWEIGELKEALIYINKAEEIFRTNFGADYYDLAPLYLNKGIILYTLKDTPEALQYFNLALELNKKINHPNISDYTLYSNIGAAYGEMNDFNNAIEYNKLALDSNPRPEIEVMILKNIAVNYKALFDDIMALKYHKVSINKANELEYPSKEYAIAYMAYSEFLLSSNHSNESRYYIDKALDAFILLYGKKNRKVCEVYTEMSKYYNSQEKYNDALKYTQLALVSGQKLFNDTSIFKNPDISKLTNDFAVFSAFLQKGKLLNKYYDKVENNIVYLKASLESARLGITILENIKSSLKGEDSKLLLTTTSNEIYDLAVEVTYKLYLHTENISYLFESFKFSEKGKAAVLLSNAREMEALQVGNIPEDIRKIEFGLKSELEQYQSILYEETQKVNPDTNKIARIRMATYRSGLVYDSLTQILEKNFPDYYNLKYNFNAISIPDIQNKISENTALVEYKVVDSILYTYLISRNTTSLIRKDVGAEFYENIQKFVSLINVMPEVTNVKRNSMAFASLGYEIYNNLSLNHPILDGKQNVIIVPDNILGYLSFDALVCSQVDSLHTGYNKLDYLVEKFAVSYGYSATLYFSGKHHIDAKDNILAMAPLYEKYKRNESNDLDMSSQREILKQITPLKHTLKEVLDIGSIIPGKLLTEGNATEANFKSMSDKYKILHFAMHAIIDDDDPLTSKLIFDIDNSDTIEDGFLNTYEIYNLDLNAELAVLSACKTGTGRLSKGEGIMSLARGFLYAGVPGIVMTLWAIEDVSSAQIITYFYEFLTDGDKKDIALRNAKLEYLKNANQLQSHPYFWAAYVQIGDNSALSTNKKAYLYYIGIAAFLMIIFVIVIRNKQKRA